MSGDSTNARRTKAANEAYASFVGSVANIERIRGFLFSVRYTAASRCGSTYPCG